jgi:hypothetical protein
MLGQGDLTLYSEPLSAGATGRLRIPEHVLCENCHFPPLADTR